MAVSKADREVIRLKFNNRCAYCGEQLQKSWHVDELHPCGRRYEFIPGYYNYGDLPKRPSEEEIGAVGGLKWIPEKRKHKIILRH